MLMLYKIHTAYSALHQYMQYLIDLIYSGMFLSWFWGMWFPESNA